MEKSNRYLVVAFFFIVLGLITILAIVFHFLYAGHKYTEYGTLGDAIGGLTNPIIAIGASILTFAAFYIQYQANKQVQMQFEEQKKKENLDYIFNKFNSQIVLIHDEINKFHFSHYYAIYTKDMPVRPEIPERKYMTFRDKELIDEYETKLKDYINSKRFEKRSFEGILAINEVISLLNRASSFSFYEDYFNKSLDNPKINEIYNILNYLDITINDIENNIDSKSSLKKDLIDKIIFLYNSKLSAIINNNINSFDNLDLLNEVMNKLHSYFNK